MNILLHNSNIIMPNSKIEKNGTITDFYLDLFNQSVNKYGYKTIVLMEVGHFYEFYGLIIRKKK